MFKKYSFVKQFLNRRVVRLLSRNWEILKPMVMLVAVVLCPLFLNTRHRREFLFFKPMHVTQ